MGAAQRIEADLRRLVKEGDKLYFSMLEDVFGREEFVAQLSKLVGEDVSSQMIDLPNFRTSYENWYSEALPAVRDLLPDRLTTFIGLYEPSPDRREINAATYTLHDFFRAVEVLQGGLSIASKKDAAPLFFKQVRIVESALARLQSSLVSIRSLLQADVFENELEVARELLDKGFNRASGAVAGVILEAHLREVCDRHRISIAKKHPGIADLAELLRSGGVIDTPRWRHLGVLADYRNLCCHNKGAEPTSDQVAELVDGTEKVLRTIHVG